MASGINATEEELVANPYILSESDLGARDSDLVALEAIDHGLFPEGNAALFPDGDEVSHDDRRRVRAVGVSVLQKAADNGDTVLTFDNFLELIYERFSERRAGQIGKSYWPRQPFTNKSCGQPWTPIRS